MEETKQQLTKRFGIGIVLIVISFILGKLVLIPLIFFPESTAWWVSMIIIYTLSWFMMIGGIFLAGVEGFRLVRDKYKGYKKETMTKVRAKGKKVASDTVNALRKPIKRLKRKAEEKKTEGL